MNLTREAWYEHLSLKCNVEYPDIIHCPLLKTNFWITNKSANVSIVSSILLNNKILEDTDKNLVHSTHKFLYYNERVKKEAPLLFKKNERSIKYIRDPFKRIYSSYFMIKKNNIDIKKYDYIDFLNYIHNLNIPKNKSLKERTLDLDVFAHCYLSYHKKLNNIFEIKKIENGIFIDNISNVNKKLKSYHNNSHLYEYNFEKIYTENVIDIFIKLYDKDIIEYYGEENIWTQ